MLVSAVALRKKAVILSIRWLLSSPRITTTPDIRAAKLITT
jgi:hypothetical protein